MSEAEHLLPVHNPLGESPIWLPVEQVTCFGFDGSEMTELYITTAWYGSYEAQRKQQPLAGELFRKNGR